MITTVLNIHVTNLRLCLHCYEAWSTGANRRRTGEGARLQGLRQCASHCSGRMRRNKLGAALKTGTVLRPGKANKDQRSAIAEECGLTIGVTATGYYENRDRVLAALTAALEKTSTLARTRKQRTKTRDRARDAARVQKARAARFAKAGTKKAEETASELTIRCEMKISLCDVGRDGMAYSG
jgi:hypothetical protein